MVLTCDLTGDFIIQKAKKMMSKMATWDLIPAKEKEQEDEMDVRGTLGEKGHILLECYNRGWKGWRP